MTDEIKKFIEDNISLIEQNKWEEIYEKADKLKISFGEFTEIMLDAGLHPEAYLRELPNSFLAYSKIKKFEIPNNVISIGPYVFYRCPSLMSVIISDNVTSIGNYAFQSCSNLTNVIIPDSVTTIGIAAFRFCYSLMNITIGNSITSIDASVFEDCTSLISMTLPDNVTELGYPAFSGCSSLTHVIISNNVISISDYAFSGCGDNLVIEYSGTKSDWKKIYNSQSFKNTYFIVNCIDGKIIKKKR